MTAAPGMRMDRHEGGCHCGRVQFAIEGPPMQSVFCHCATCRLSSGAPFVMVGFWQRRTTSHNFLLALLRARDPAVVPTHHIYYAERIIDVDDRLPRFDGWTWL